MFKILETSENIGFSVLLKIKIWSEYSRQIPDSPPPQQGDSDPISGLTGLYVYLFYPNLFPSQINIISPKKQP